MISLLLATYNRRDVLIKCLTSLQNTTAHLPIELVVFSDGDFYGDIWENLFKNKPENWRVVLNHSSVRRGALPAWNLALRESSGDLLMPIGNDQFFYNRWLDLALDAHRNRLNGYGLVAVNDLNLDGNKQVGTTVIFDRKFCQDVLGGVVAYPVYNYYYIDVELNERAKGVGKYYWCKESIVEHLHPSNQKREMDDADRERVNNDWQEKDRIIFENRKARGFPNEWVSMI